MRDLPIGVFDSGIGGLTVVKEIINTLPNESILYIGDTARVPYGTRGKKVITKFALELANFLIKKKIKVLVVACNTISATCLKEIEKVSPVPVIGVIQPAAQHALTITKNGKIGVIGTRATIGSKVYEENLGKNTEVKLMSCPLFVPLAEEGLISSPATKIIAKEYLNKFTDGLDTLILGCTHYPVLRKVIQQVVGKKVTLVDSAKPTALTLNKLLKRINMLSSSAKPRYEFFVTDAPKRVFEVANILFEGKLPAPLRLTSL
ncbi:glutamate racemase [Candidatus Daviesbacteria bacterium]|nr:glutamate racemase [Candidatus Daviesbacteria bacterium]